MKNLIFSAFLIVFFILSCSKDDNAVRIKSDIFQCCNIWGDFRAGPSTVEEAVKDFLIGEEITSTKITKGTGSPAAFCQTCCGCPTGEAIFIKINRVDLQRALDLGFIEE